jgi:hypothetical protein
MIVHRVFSALFGLVLVVAGLVAASYIMVDFRVGLLSGLAAILIPGVLMLSAFYMAVKFVRFAVTGKKQEH